MEQVVHPFPPVYDERSRVLLLGTMPSPQSRARGYSYAHPQNRFWPVLAALLGEELPEGGPQRLAMALRHGVALWDVLARCSIEGASDGSIRQAVPNDLRTVLDRAPIAAVFTTGKKAHALYRALCHPRTGREDICLPSTSPANAGWSFDRLLQAYRVILPYLAPPGRED